MFLFFRVLFVSSSGFHYLQFLIWRRFFMNLDEDQLAYLSSNKLKCSKNKREVGCEWTVTQYFHICPWMHKGVHFQLTEPNRRSTWSQNMVQHWQNLSFIDKSPLFLVWLLCFVSSGFGSFNYWGGSAFWASSIHHWTERKWNSQDDGWIWGVFE